MEDGGEEEEDGDGDGGGDGENIITATALRMRCSIALNMADMVQYFCFVTLCAKLRDGEESSTVLLA